MSPEDLERDGMRAMHQALVSFANDHDPKCCRYCAHVRARIDAVLMLAPKVEYGPGLPKACEKWSPR